MLLMAENQDDRVIWVVVELHRPKKRIRSRIILHLGEFRDRDEAEAAFRERLSTNPILRECTERWKRNAADVLTDRKARAKFLRFGALTGGLVAYADDLLRRREQDEEHARARTRASLWSPGGPLAAFALLGLSSALATVEDIKLHPDRGGDLASMVALNAAYEEAVHYANWRG